mgnify:CR=1 FL=1
MSVMFVAVRAKDCVLRPRAKRNGAMRIILLLVISLLVTWNTTDVAAVEKPLLMQAHQAMKDGHVKKGFGLYLKCAEEGNGTCMTYVAQYFWLGLPTKTDGKKDRSIVNLEKAIYWHKKSYELGTKFCKSGFNSALFLTQIYSGIKKDIDQGVAWVRKSKGLLEKIKRIDGQCGLSTKTIIRYEKRFNDILSRYGGSRN